jgi:hypothetical protein
MLTLIRYFYYFFGLLTPGVGIQAFVRCNAKASLLRVGLFGILRFVLLAWPVEAFPEEPMLETGFVLLLAALALQLGWATLGLVTGLLCDLLLAGKLLPKFFEQKCWWPVGVQAWLGSHRYDSYHRGQVELLTGNGEIRILPLKRLSH